MDRRHQGIKPLAAHVLDHHAAGAKKHRKEPHHFRPPIGQAGDLADPHSLAPQAGNLFAVDVLHGHSQVAVGDQAHRENHHALIFGDENLRGRQKVIRRHPHLVVVHFPKTAAQVRRVDEPKGGCPFLSRLGNPAANVGSDFCRYVGPICSD